MEADGPQTPLRHVKAVDNPSPGDAPTGVDFELEFFEYAVQNAGVGGSTVVNSYLSSGAQINTYYMYGPEPGNSSPHWYAFLYDGQTGAEINGDVITLHFVDGKRGDNDLIQNGTISQLGAPGLTASMVTLTMGSSGNGSITPAVGTYEYVHGTVITISAIPAQGWQFVGWIGDVAAPYAGNTTVEMDMDKTVSAIFSLIIPTLNIQANGSDEPLIVSSGEAVAVTIELEAGGLVGTNADWWVLAKTSMPNKWFCYNHVSGSWSPGQVVTHQGPLFDLNTLEVLSRTNLPPGTYVFYFGVDTNMNGTIDMEAMFYDSIIVAVSPAQ